MKNELKYNELARYIYKLHNYEEMFNQISKILKLKVSSKYKSTIDLTVYKHTNKIHNINKTINKLMGLEEELSTNSKVNKYIDSKSPLIKKKKIINAKSITFIIGIKKENEIEEDLKDIVDYLLKEDIKYSKALTTKLSKRYAEYKIISKAVNSIVIKDDDEITSEARTLNIFINKILLEDEMQKLQVETEIYNELVQIRDKFIEQIYQIEENIKVSKSEIDFNILEVEISKKENNIDNLKKSNKIKETKMEEIEVLIERIINDIETIQNKNFLFKMFLAGKKKKLEISKEENEDTNNNIMREIVKNLDKIKEFEKEMKAAIDSFFKRNKLEKMPIEAFKRKLNSVKEYASELEYIDKLSKQKSELLNTNKKLMLSKKRFNDSKDRCNKLMIKDTKEVKTVKKKELVA